MNQGIKVLLLGITVALLSISSNTQAEPATGSRIPTQAELAPGSNMTEPKTGMKFVWIPAGCFNMGSNEGAADEKPRHNVCFQSGFWMGKYEVTQAQYLKLIGDNPSEFKDNPNKPVEKVSWSDAHNMAAEMSYVAAGNYRLPSEAEWEYACKAGRDSAYCGSSDKVSRLAWYDINSGQTTHRVGGKQANNWGLHDMNGNVNEWTLDCSNDSYAGAPSDGSAWMRGDCTKRVLRGGSWYYYPGGMRSADRYRSPANDSKDSYGFRLVLQTAPTPLK